MTDAELGEAVNEAYREIFNLQFQRGTRQLQNPMAMRSARKQIARLRTILRERQIAVAAGAPIEPLARVADEVEDEQIEEAPESQAQDEPDGAAEASDPETDVQMDEEE